MIKNEIMKKLYSTIMMLAMMVAALSFSACGSNNGEDDDFNDDSPSDYMFSITYDDEVYKFGEGYFKLFPEAAVWYEKEHYFYLGISRPAGYVGVTFTSSVSSKDLTFGYNDFTPYVHARAGVKFKSKDYSSGSATVISNNGEYIILKFSKYTFIKEPENMSYNTHTYIIDGIVKFLIKEYY